MKVLLVSDDPSVCEAVGTGVARQWRDSQVITAANGVAARAAFGAHDPDVVVLDAAVPGGEGSGFEVLREIRGVSDAPVVLISGRGSETDQVQGLELGADDYVVKPFGQRALLARIQAVLRRAELPPVRALPDFETGDLAIKFESQQVTVRGESVKLTPLEYRLLYHLVRDVGRLLPHRLLLERVWGEDAHPGPNHVKVFVCRLRAKLERPGGPRYVESARGIGYRFVRPNETVRAA